MKEVNGGGGDSLLADVSCSKTIKNTHIFSL